MFQISETEINLLASEIDSAELDLLKLDQKEVFSGDKSSSSGSGGSYNNWFDNHRLIAVITEVVQGKCVNVNSTYNKVEDTIWKTVEANITNLSLGSQK